MRSGASAERADALGLSGRRILVPRGGAAGERWAQAVRERGGEPVVAALTETAEPQDPGPLTAAVERWNRGDYDWLVVTSANGAHAVADAGARPATAAGAARVAAVGPATAEALRERGFAVALQPEHDFSAAGVANALIDVIGDRAAREQRLLLPLSEIASTELEEALLRAGHAPERIAAYRTVPAPRDAAQEARIVAGGVDAILVLSGSGAAELARRFGPTGGNGLPGGAMLAAIGAPTARALAAHGLRADVVAARHTVGGLLDALAEHVADPGSRDSARAGSRDTPRTAPRSDARTSAPAPDPALDPALDPAPPGGPAA